jgi:hypothetical protein
MKKPKITVDRFDRTFLMHGFLSGANFDSKPLYDSGGILKQQLYNCRELKLNIGENLDLFSLNLINLWILYRRTQLYCKKEETLNSLKLKLEYYDPKTIICHSLSCQLLENYIQSGRKLPAGTQKVIYCQPDTRTISSDLIETIYSKYDLKLWLSAILNTGIPLGLYPDTNLQHCNSNHDLFHTLQSHPFLPVGSHLAPLDFGITVE